MSTKKGLWVTPTKQFRGCADVCILVVDCNPISLRAVSGMLRSLSYEVLTATRATDALAMTLNKACGVDLVITELHMPDMYGLDFLDEIEKTSHLPVLIMSADRREESMLSSLQRGAEFYISKPVIMPDLADIWQYIFDKRYRREQRLEAQKNKGVVVEAVEESLIEEEGAMLLYGDECSAVCDRRKKTATETGEESEEEEEEEEDTLTSPSQKKVKLIDESSRSGNASGGSVLGADSVEEDRLIPPPPLTPPQEQGAVKASEAEAEDEREGSDAAAKGGDTLFPN